MRWRFLRYRLSIGFVVLTLFPLWSTAQEDTLKFFQTSPTFNKQRLVTVISTETVLYTSALVGLGTIWYADYPKSDFHTFDDSREWHQMDKWGHFMTAYYLNNAGMGMYRWTGLDEKKVIWLGGTMGTLFLLGIEIFDGYSKEWGFSVGDMAANIGGRVMSMGEQLLWQEQRIKMKFSYHQTEFAQYRPELLGGGGMESMFKDYNGQSYWVSTNISSFMKEDTKFPKWLNVAFGYGAEGMIGGHENPEEVDGVPVSFPRYRQYFFSLDADLSRIPTKSPFLKFVLGAFGFVKIPFSALEYNGVDGFKFHPIYY